MIVLKIGGSVITDKSPGAVNKAKFEEIERIAKDISENLGEPLVLIHGVGSFGHPHVVKYGLRERKDVDGISITHLSCVSLNIIVCGYLRQFGLKPIPFHPMSTFKISEGAVRFDFELVRDLAEDGFIPVMHGDMVYDEDRSRYVILSGDVIVAEVSKALNPDRIGFATDVDGVIVNGRVVEVLNRDMLPNISDAKDKEDVTGGMRGKVEVIFRYRLDAYVFNAKDIDKFLRGERVGTLVRGFEDI